MMIPGQKNIIINSAILFVIASVTATTLHEFGHFFASILVHAKQISIHHNYTSNIDAGLPLASVVFIKGAGPLVSFIIGILFHFLCSRQATRNILFLFKLYMSAFGYIGFFGYLLIAPMFQVGDTGYICHLLGFPVWLTIMFAVAGATTLYFLMASLMKYFVEMASKEIIEDKTSRKIFMRYLLLYPLAIGIIVTTLLNLPTPVFLSLIAPVCIPFTFLWAYGNAIYKKYDTHNANKGFEIFSKVKPQIIIFLVLVIAINRLLAHGIFWN